MNELWPAAPAWPERAPGVVKVRVSGAPGDIEAMTEILSGYGAEVLDRWGPYADRRGPGQRVYLTVLLGLRVEVAVLRAERDQARAIIEAAVANRQAGQ